MSGAARCGPLKVGGDAAQGCKRGDVARARRRGSPVGQYRRLMVALSSLSPRSPLAPVRKERPDHQDDGQGVCRSRAKNHKNCHNAVTG